MKDFSKATPRPWKMNKGEAWTKQIAIIDPVRNHYLCTIGKRFDNSEANAELIITAVNNFDKMKEALEKHLVILKALIDAGVIEKHENGKYSIIEETEQLLESLK